MALLDFLICKQRRWTHTVPALRRLHRVRHADPEPDVTTGLRFHPAEILLSMALKMAAVAALGAPAVVVLVFEVLLKATAMFNHAVIRLPASLEPWLRPVDVTQEMRRTHHSEVRAETNSGYRVAGAAGGALVIGVEGWRDERQRRLDRLPLQPARSAP